MEKIQGLSQQEVQERKEKGLVNATVSSGTKSVDEIIRGNVCTFFNGIFLVLSFLLLIAGKFKDITFMGVVVANTVIGTYQELKSKKAVDELRILSSKKIQVFRDGSETTIPSEELVQGDVIILEAGDQVPADGVILRGEVKVNESLLTGEEDDISRGPQQELHSGSAISSGRCIVQLTSVGEQSYAAKLKKEATTNVKQVKSEMMKSLDKLIRVIGFILVPMGVLLFYNEYFVLQNSFSTSIQSMVAALVGMIPEGLYLLTSVALASSVLRLTRKHILVRNLDCVETLARIDTLCVDKTGTITEPGMHMEQVVPLEGKYTRYEEALQNFAHSFEVENETLKAIKKQYPKRGDWTVEKVVPFSSSLKYSAVGFKDMVSIVVGAPQFVYGKHLDSLSLQQYTEKGYRVLLAGTYTDELTGGPLNQDAFCPFAILVLSNAIRKGAEETFSYFASQGVQIKVISGDDPETVSRIARLVHIRNAEKYVDCTTLKEEDIPEAVRTYTVFGRTTPQQKQKMVRALQEQGHPVAMTGDGVNDVLALKEADCGIAMASGTDAASQIAKLVLLDSDFSSVPSIVAEGRRVINNIERSAQLFLAKNIFSIGLSLFCILFQLNYPFKPIQLSFLSALTIGIPGFFLAMQPNEARIEGSFLKNVIYRAFPGGVSDLILIAAIAMYGYFFKFSSAEINTMAITISLIVGLDILYYASRPLNIFRWCILILSGAGAFAGLLVFHDFLSLTRLSLQATLLFTLFVLLAVPCMNAILWVVVHVNAVYHSVLNHFRKSR